MCCRSRRRESLSFLSKVTYCPRLRSRDVPAAVSTCTVQTREGLVRLTRGLVSPFVGAILAGRLLAAVRRVASGAAGLGTLGAAVSTISKRATSAPPEEKESRYARCRRRRGQGTEGGP